MKLAFKNNQLLKKPLGASRNGPVKVIVAALLIGLALIAGRHFWHDDQPILKTYPSQVINHPSAWTEQAITEAEKSAGVITKLTRSNPQASLLIRAQATTAVETDLESVTKGVVNALSSEITGFKLLNKSINKIGNTKLIEIEYQQTQDQITSQNHMVIIPTKDKVYYLVYRVVNADLAPLKADIATVNHGFVASIEKQ